MMGMQTTALRSYRVVDNDRLLDDTEYVLRFKDLPDEERPREKLLASGPHSLNQAELVAVLWSVGTRKEDVLAMAKRTLQEYGEHATFAAANPTELAVTLEYLLPKRAS
jgi:hypothetical protein